MAGRKDTLVVSDGVDVHAGGDTRGDCIRWVGDGDGGYTLEALGCAVGEAES